MPALDRPVITGEPEMVGLVKVLLVNVCVRVSRTILPEASGKVIVLSAVGSVTCKKVSFASPVAPSKVIPVSPTCPPVIIGDVKVLLVRVCVLVVPTTLPSPEAKP